MENVLRKDECHACLGHDWHVFTFILTEEGCLSTFEAFVEIKLKGHFTDLVLPVDSSSEIAVAMTSEEIARVVFQESQSLVQLKRLVSFDAIGWIKVFQAVPDDLRNRY